MESTLGFKDIIKKSVLEAGSFLQPHSLSTMIQVVEYILLGLIIGLLLYWLYRKTYAGVVYSQAFAISLAGMAVLTTAIIVTIQSNIGLSLGMVGALSIVRYRTAIKDPMDLMFLFWAVAAGIATGAGLFYIALFLSLIMGLLLFLLRHRKHVRDQMYIILVHYTGNETEYDVRRALNTMPYQIKSKTMRKEDVEMAIEVRVKRENLAFADTIRNLRDVRDVTLVQYDGDYID